MSRTTRPASQKPPASLTRSLSNLPTAIIKKLTGSDKTAPLFVARQAEDKDGLEDVVELACGHIFGKKNANDDKARGAIFGLLSGSNSLAAHLSISEATRCPICESSNRYVGMPKISDARQRGRAVMWQSRSDRRLAEMTTICLCQSLTAIDQHGMRAKGRHLHGTNLTHIGTQIL